MKNQLSSSVKEQFRSLKNLAEELQVQMALGKAEARDLLENERKNLSKYLKNHQKQVSNLNDETTKDSAEILSSLQSLDSLLYNDIPVTETGYDSYKNEVLKNIYTVEDSLRSSKQNYSSNIQENLGVFKNKMDAYRVNLALHDTENPEKVQNVKRDFTNRLEKVINLLNDRKESEEKLDRFTQDISESFNYLKKAISDLAK